MRHAAKVLGWLGALLPAAAVVAAGNVDRYRWLETPRDAKALEWARTQSEKTASEIATMPRRAELKAALVEQAPPPDYLLLGNKLLRFQRTSDHPHGIVEIAALAANGKPQGWRSVLNMDALRSTEGRPLELHFGPGTFKCLPPAQDRCLFSLSPDGGDDVEQRWLGLSEQPLGLR